MSLFQHHISFKRIDPLGDGLREEIEQEQLEPEAITSFDEDGEELISRWQKIEEDIEQDPEWFKFTDE